MTPTRPPSRDATPAVVVRNLSHSYGERRALADVSLAVERGEMFGLLGPNGGGKTTLFKILATLVAPQRGSVTVLGTDAARAPLALRRRLGVVFQHPGLDGMLSVAENLWVHGALYGITGRALRARMDLVLERVGLSDRADDRVVTLSGGLARRAELAKGLLHGPELILLDEPTSGLDPGARRDFVRYLLHLRDAEGVTIVLTTHDMDEAERCDRVGVVHRGALVAVDRPDALKAQIGGDVVEVQGDDAPRLAERIRDRFGCEPVLVDGKLRIEIQRAHELARDVAEAFPDEVRAVTFGKPTLEDVFVHLTGHRFWQESAP